MNATMPCSPLEVGFIGEKLFLPELFCQCVLNITDAFLHQLLWCGVRASALYKRREKLRPSTARTL